MARFIAQSFYLEAAKVIRDERDRQVTVEGYDQKHDAQYSDGELVRAGLAYLLASSQAAGAPPVTWSRTWPWAPKHFKPRDRRSNLIRAGALFTAERDKRCATSEPAGATVDHLIEATVVELADELDRRWRLGVNMLPAPSEPTLETALAQVQAEFPGAFWMLAYGRTKADEPPYGARILFSHDEVLGEGEGETPAAAVMAAIEHGRSASARSLVASA